MRPRSHIILLLCPFNNPDFLHKFLRLPILRLHECLCCKTVWWISFLTLIELEGFKSRQRAELRVSCYVG